MPYLVSANTWNTVLGNCWHSILNVITFHIQPLKNIITSNHNWENDSKELSYDYTIQTIKLTLWTSDGDKHTFIALRYVKSLLTQLRFKSVLFPNTLRFARFHGPYIFNLAEKPIGLSLAPHSPMGFSQFHTLVEVLLAGHPDLGDLILTSWPWWPGLLVQELLTFRS